MAFQSSKPNTATIFGDKSATRFEINPEVGYNFNDSWAVGVNVGFASVKGTWDELGYGAAIDGETVAQGIRQLTVFQQHITMIAHEAVSFGIVYDAVRHLQPQPGGVHRSRVSQQYSCRGIANLNCPGLIEVQATIRIVILILHNGDTIVFAKDIHTVRILCKQIQGVLIGKKINYIYNYGDTIAISRHCDINFSRIWAKAPIEGCCGCSTI